MNTNQLISISFCVYMHSLIFLDWKKKQQKNGLKCEYAYAAHVIDYLITFY